jgi:hypothetical protein
MIDQTIAPGEACAVAAWAAIPEERRAIILAGQAAIVNRRKALDDWIAIGKAFHELQHEAMQQSNSKQPKGRRYSDAYAALELRQEIANLRKIDKSDRKKAIWLYQNEEPVRHWYATLSQSQRDRWTRTQTIKLHYRRASQQDDGEGKPATKRPSALQKARAEIAQLHQELDAAEDKILRRDEAELGRLERANAEIARLQEKLDAAHAKLGRMEQAEDDKRLRLKALAADPTVSAGRIVALLLSNRLTATGPTRPKVELQPTADREIRQRGKKRRVKVEYRKLELRRTEPPGERHWDDRGVA